MSMGFLIRAFPSVRYASGLQSKGLFTLVTTSCFFDVVGNLFDVNINFMNCKCAVDVKKVLMASKVKLTSKEMTPSAPNPTRHAPH